MDEYGIKFYKNEEEIEIEQVPEEYLNGIIQVCESEIASRRRLERLFHRMIKKDNWNLGGSNVWIHNQSGNYESASWNFEGVKSYQKGFEKITWNIATDC